MLLTSALRATIVLACIAQFISPAQGQERVPSGDLSDFFNPPGIKSESLNSTTRKLGSATKPAAKTTPAKADPATAPKASMPKGTPIGPAAPGSATKDPAPPAETEPKPKVAPRKASAGEQVKLETKKVEAPIEGGISFGPPSRVNWRVGVVMLTGSKAVNNVVCRIPVPVQWPEQKVSVFEENLPSEVTDVSWEDLGNVRLMKCRIGNVPPGTRVIATVTFAVSTSQIIGPKNTSIFRIPEKRTRDIRPYFGESPGIGLRNTKLKKQAKDLFDNTQSDWVKVQSLYDWVRENVEERAGDNKGSVTAFQNGYGNSVDRVGLFVAMCRINKVPARMVFVDGGQYAEFYLVDDKKQGHWFPCKVSGIREFGSIGEPRVVLQKGDNYRVPGEKKLQFVNARGTVKGGSRPRILKFAREPLSVN